MTVLVSGENIKSKAYVLYSRRASILERERNVIKQWDFSVIKSIYKVLLEESQLRISHCGKSSKRLSQRRFAVNICVFRLRTRMKQILRYYKDFCFLVWLVFSVSPCSNQPPLIFCLGFHIILSTRLREF